MAIKTLDLVASAGSLITGDGQLEYNGYLLGDDEKTYTTSINGWDDIPGIDNGNTPRAGSHGGWVGRKLSGMRVITWQGRFAPAQQDWANELTVLRKALSLPLGEEEYPIVVRSHEETRMCFGALIQRAIPLDYQYGYYGASLTVQFECSDPRRYSLGENTWTLSMPQVVPVGLTYPLTYPLYYGESTTSSTGNLVNDGDVETPVQLVFSGPITTPALYNDTLKSRLEFDITLAAGETLTVDTRDGTVLLNGVADRLYTRTANSAPILSFYLLPGDNQMRISASTWGDGASVEITWRDATL